MPKSVKICLLHSLTGTMAISERSLLDAELLAIEEINDAGGILGCRIDPKIADGASSPAIFAEKARDLIYCCTPFVFGCWTSASRKAVRAVVEASNTLLFYPVQYEGLEESPNIIYTGSCLNQQIVPALQWIFANIGSCLYLVGSDYVFPRAANKVIRSFVESQMDSGVIVGERYVPFGGTDFSSIICEIRECAPLAIFNTLNGDSNITFYQHLRDAGLNIPVMAVSIGESEIQHFKDGAAGHYACWSYFQSLDLPENRRFVARFKKRFGESAVCSASMVTACSQIFLWKQAVEAAGDFDPQNVNRHILGQTFRGPGGEITIRENRHAVLPALIGKARADGQFEIVSTMCPIEPLPWLGVEEFSFPTKLVVREALAAFPDVVHMMSQLDQQMREREKAEEALQTLNQTLEDRVRSRTRELSASNWELRTEIVERKRAENALLAAKQQIEIIIRIAPFAITYIDTNLRYVYANDQYVALLGLTQELIIGKTIPEVIGETAWKLRQPYLDRAFAGESCGFETEVDYGNSVGKRFMSLAFVPNLDRHGFVAGVVVTAFDLTERKRTEEELLKAKQLAEAGNRAKSEFLAIMSHEIRTPMAAVLGMLDLILENGESQPDLHTMLGTARESANRLMSLLNDILDSAAIEAEKLEVVIKKFNLRLCLKSVFALFAVGFAKKNLRSDMAVSDEIPDIIQGDENRLRQVLVNLIGNAIKFTEEGVIRVEVSLNEAKNRIIFLVQDTGIGIPEEKLEVIFNPFTQVDASSTRRYGGTGLGLSLSRKLIELMGGELWVESQVGKGSTFGFSLPLITAEDRLC